jgi:hypothetical protein
VLPAGRRFTVLLEETFAGAVERSPIVWKNLPPALVYRCEKKGGGKGEKKGGGKGGESGWGKKNRGKGGKSD